MVHFHSVQFFSRPY